MGEMALPEETTSTNQEIACPWCGRPNRELYEYNIEEGALISTECGWCEKPFTLCKIVCVTYIATPLSLKEPG